MTKIHPAGSMNVCIIFQSQSAGQTQKTIIVQLSE